MTGQIMNSLHLDDEDFAIVGLSAPERLTFREFHASMNPRMMHTACYAGFYYRLSVHQNKLTLLELVLCTEDDVFEPINQIEPIIDRDVGHYFNVHLPLSFSGKIRVGRKFINGMYDHMGYQHYTRYETVLDLVFFSGILSSCVDISSRVALAREKLYSKSQTNTLGYSDRIREIELSFSLQLEDD